MRWRSGEGRRVVRLVRVDLRVDQMDVLHCDEDLGVSHFGKRWNGDIGLGSLFS